MESSTKLKYIDTRLNSKVTDPSSQTRYPTHSNQNPDVFDIAIINAFGLD